MGKDRSLDASGLGRERVWPLKSSTREFCGVTRLFSILITMVCGPQSHNTEYWEGKPNTCLDYITWWLHGCTHLSKWIGHLKWVNFMYVNYTSVTLPFKKSQPGLCPGSWEPAGGQFQKHLVSKPPGPPQGSAENAINILGLCRDKKKVSVGKKDWGFLTWTGFCSTFINLLSVYHHSHLYSGNNNFLASYLPGW